MLLLRNDSLFKFHKGQRNSDHYNKIELCSNERNFRQKVSRDNSEYHQFPQYSVRRAIENSGDQRYNHFDNLGKESHWKASSCLECPSKII